METVRGWKKSRHAVQRRLGEEWALVLGRDVKWKMAYNTVLKEKGQERGMDFPPPEVQEERIRKELPARLSNIEFKVDMAPLDPRPDPKDTRGIPLYVYDPATQAVSTEPLEDFLDLLPTRIMVFRVYAPSHDHDAELSRAAAAVLNKAPSSIDTNV